MKQAGLARAPFPIETDDDSSIGRVIDKRCRDAFSNFRKTETINVTAR